MICLVFRIGKKKKKKILVSSTMNVKIDKELYLSGKRFTQTSGFFASQLIELKTNSVKDIVSFATEEI